VIGDLPQAILKHRSRAQRWRQGFRKSRTSFSQKASVAIDSHVDHDPTVIFEARFTAARSSWFIGLALWLVSSIAGLCVPAGSVVAWGINANGEVTMPAAATNVVALAAGYDHSLALRSDGTVVGWGNDTYHQIDIPVGLSNVVAVGGGYAHSLALKSDGALIGWGNNDYNQASAPPGLSNVTSISVGYYHNIAFSGDGKIVIWGGNFWNQLAIPDGSSLRPRLLRSDSSAH